MTSSIAKLGKTACRLLAAGSSSIQLQSRSIVHKSLLRLPPDYPDPWPYKEKGYNYTDAIRDRTQSRFHQNSKLIVVEGNIGVGKSKLSRELADQLGFYYMPEFKMEDILIDRYGNDLRKFYHLFPESFRMPDMDMFYKNPMSDMSAKMQQRIFECRFDQFLNAVAHILNTGQGVVLERTPYSDFVFVNAMRSKNFVGHEYLKHYYYVRKAALPQLHFWPHLVVYLDAPVHKCLENIRARGNASEIAAVDEKYLKTIEESYKDSLKEYRRHSKILAYDWTRPGDADTVVEDIERLDFDFFEWHSGDVMEEWFTLVDEVGWNGWRQHVTSKVDARLYAFGGMSTHEVGELYINPRDAGHFMHVMRKEVLKSPHSYGFIAKNGDHIQGLMNWRHDHSLPEPWYEYYYKEACYDDMASMETSLDPHSYSYDPDYLHHHH
ncbi:deoxynucleoside kinase [Necator americanus]|uniref:NADH dehydrogenase [ubiquinone] 1 alpha subcomplex subunit 10, mitochondrial n=1 Tax=Necator americanus TaxID=51031 RepID=W2SIH8_NECAM|nr:deoxynucleoside kinase [Necator americanus]ETN69380.1 deoxynucleoside kinase [Necator americanus]